MITSKKNKLPLDIAEALRINDVSTIRRYQSQVGKPDLTHIPGTRGLPIVGHSLSLLTHCHDWLDTQYAKHGNVFRMNMAIMDSVMLLGPEANKLVFQNEGKIFSNHLAYDNVLRNLLNNAVLARDFEDHKSLRKTLQKAFKRESIEGHVELMNPVLKETVSNWKTISPIKTMYHIKELLLTIGAKVFLGIDTGPQTDKLNRAFINIVKGTGDPLRRKELWISPYAKGVRANRFLSQYMSREIPLRRGKPGRDLLTQICNLENSGGFEFSDEEICDQILFVLFAAHDTTTSALSAILYSLATNQSWQESLRQEIFNLDKDTLDLGDLDALIKTDWTFKEALRMYPALVFFGRYSLKEFEFGGHVIPANTPVTISPLFTHYMPEYWSNPHTFDPERFSPERAEDKKDFYQYIPFGGGAHKCLGMHFAQVQAKMFLFYLLKNFWVNKNPRMTRYRYNNVPLTFPTDGLPLTLTKI